MLRYFPNLFHDELLYSALSRYSNHMETGKFKPAVKELFGTENAIATWEFPSCIEHLVKNIDSGQCYTAEQIIFSHTMLPLYYPFLDKKRQQYALEHMKGKNGKGIHMKLGVMASKVKGLNSLRYCPVCISEDIKQYGIAYWHRSHNVPGISVCHKHGVALRESCPICGVMIAPKSKNEFISLTDRCPNGHTLLIDRVDNRQDYDKELKLAKAVNYLLSTNLRDFNSIDVHKFYDKCLREKNLITATGRISQGELIEQFKLHYNKGFLQQLGLDIETKSGDNWLSSLIRRQDRVSHPLKHILLINFLIGDIAVFFEQSQVEYHPFGKAPWLCLNPVADHYGQPVVTKCNVTRCCDTKKPVGTFECECGFIYSRRGPDTCEEDKYKVGRIKEFGAVWEDRLKSLSLNQDRSLRSIAKEMKADPTTIKKYLEKLKSQDSSLTTVTTNRDKVTDASISKDELSKLYADKIIGYINENSQVTRNMVRSRFQKEYIWLYRHKRELLYEVLPKPTTRKKQSSRIDWGKRDLEIFKLVRDEIIRILKADKAQRVTLSRIGKNLSLLPILEQHLDKLPKTKQLLDKFTETIESFQLRRANSIIRQMLLDGEDVKPWVVFRKAGFGNSCSEVVKQKVIDLIQKQKAVEDTVNTFNSQNKQINAQDESTSTKRGAFAYIYRL